MTAAAHLGISQIEKRACLRPVCVRYSQGIGEYDETGGFVGIGLALGAAVGEATDNIALGVALGIALGAAIGAVKFKRDVPP
mgnify:CR=1 FL=1